MFLKTLVNILIIITSRIEYAQLINFDLKENDLFGRETAIIDI